MANYLSVSIHLLLSLRLTQQLCSSRYTFYELKYILQKLLVKCRLMFLYSLQILKK